MRLFIEPNDILMFRDGRPFAGGEEHFAKGVFPPSPATIYGALRSHILSAKWPEYNKYASGGQIPEHIQKEIGTPEQLGALALCQLTMAKRIESGVEQFFPMPKDIAQGKGDNDGTLYLLSPTNLSGSSTITDMPEKMLNLWHPSDKPLESVAGYLTSTGMGEYLAGKAPSSWVKSGELFETEERTGIRKSRTKRSVEQGGLYTVEYVRMNADIGFAIEADNTELLPDSGILRLGGDNRSARYSKTSWHEILLEPIKKKIAESNRFKLELTTPAIFNKGWLPDGINRDTMQGQINGIAVKMIAACVGKPVGIGGYDFVRNMPKVMKKAVPAGSVYYFEIAAGDVNGLLEKIWLKSISDQRSQEGFGITLMGGY